MMKADGYDVPDNLHYNKEHEWILTENGKPVRMGITDYAQRMLKEITFVYLPEKGMTVKRLEAICTIESIKAISELYSPFTGRIVEVNEKLGERPGIINEDPYGEGWIIAINPSRLKKEVGKMIRPEQYAEYVKELIKIDRDLLIYRWRERGRLGEKP
jgi:glycine cleavage system H protein